MERNSLPQIALRQNTAERDRISGLWRMKWMVTNLGRYPLHLLSVRFPHRQFRADEHVFEPLVDLKANGDIQFEMLVQCDESPGLVTENAFAIFCVKSRRARWRIFVRLKVIVTGDGKPETTTELITTQKAGFSGVES